jgi:serine/threonine protein kinase
MIGREISHYRILEKLGEGGMGVVYKAHDTKLNRDVALKFLPVHLSTNETEKRRFLQEAKAAAAINHPNVCMIHDIFEKVEQLFIVMEYVEGQTLRDLNVGANGHSPLHPITDVLHAAHEKGVVQRDIKSENIMVNDKKQIKVMDFGLAKIKGASRLMDIYLLYRNGTKDKIKFSI